jgi:type I restriction enzyme M protein
MANGQSKLNDTYLREASKGVEIREELFSGILIHDIKPDGSPTPEGTVRISWIIKLIKEYGFNSKQIEIEVPAGRIGRAAEHQHDLVWADIVVYRDDIRSEPFIVVETKAPDEILGVRQAESYARNLGAEFHIWHDGRQPPKYFLTSRFTDKSKSIGGIPRWIGEKPVIQEVPKTAELPPFRSETHLREVVHQCHELILEKQGHDPAKAFDELTKLLFLKLFDEREVPTIYKFMVLASETPSDVAKKLRVLFKEAVMASRYKDVFFSKYNRNVKLDIELDDFTIFKIVQLLQGYSLVNTTESIYGADIKGTVFEQMVGNTFRGELAQFFTPREIVEFIVDIIPPSKNTKIFDPACGSGGFLIMAIKKLKEILRKDYPNLNETELSLHIRYFAENNLFGSDINDRMVRVAKMNMIMHGDGHAGLLNTNGLLTDSEISESWLKEVKTEALDIIYSNPPFAGREKDPDILKQFSLGKNKHGIPRSVSKEVLFIEMIIKSLKVGGKAGLVLPAGIFNNPSMSSIRDYIKKNVKITGLVGLPHLAFQVTGANNEGHILFIEKTSEIPDDYDIFIDWAMSVGINSVGHKTDKNDLNSIIKHFELRSPENIIKFSDLKDRIDPWYYHPNYSKILTAMGGSGYPWESMGDLFYLSKDLFNPKDHKGEVLMYIEKGDVDAEAGKITSFFEYPAETIPNRATFILRGGDILFPDAYDCIRGVVIVPNEYDGYIATSRFFVMKHNPEKILLEYAKHLLSKPEILALVKRECSGEINPGINWTTFANIKIPLPPLSVQEEILMEIHKIEKEIEILRGALLGLDTKIDDEFRKALPKVIENYEFIKIKRAEFISETRLL